jgi:hypothetical protein
MRLHAYAPPDVRRPLPGDEGERAVRREAARVKRFGGSLALVSLRVDDARTDEVVASILRECAFAVEGEPGEILIALIGGHAAGARVFLERLRARFAALPAPPLVAAGIAELGPDEPVDDTVARARLDAFASEEDPQ